MNEAFCAVAARPEPKLKWRRLAVLMLMLLAWTTAALPQQDSAAKRFSRRTGFSRKKRACRGGPEFGRE